MTVAAPRKFDPVTRHGHKSLPPDQAERVRTALREFVQQHGTQTAASKALGISQQTLSKLTMADRPSDPGVYIAQVLARCLGMTFDELTTGQRRIFAENDHRPIIRNLPGWEEAVAEVRIRYGRRITDDLIEMVGEMAGRRLPDRATPEFVLNMALALDEGMKRGAEETERVKADLEAKKAQREAEDEAAIAKRHGRQLGPKD